MLLASHSFVGGTAYIRTYVLCTTEVCISVYTGVTGEEGPVTVSVHVTSHSVPLVPSPIVPEAPASHFTTKISVKASPPPRFVLGGCSAQCHIYSMYVCT